MRDAVLCSCADKPKSSFVVSVGCGVVCATTHVSELLRGSLGLCARAHGRVPCYGGAKHVCCYIQKVTI